MLLHAPIIGMLVVRQKPSPPAVQTPIVVVQLAPASASVLDRPLPTHEPAAASGPAPVATLASVTAPPRPTVHDAAVRAHPAPGAATAADPVAAAHDARDESQPAPPDDPLRVWEQRVLAQLDRHKRYPAIAALNGQRDRIAVRIRVDRRGSVLSRTIVSSRGYPALDGEALALVGRADPLPAPPAEVEERELDFRVDIDFEMPGRSRLN